MVPANATALLVMQLERRHGKTFASAMVWRVARVAGGRILVGYFIEARNVGKVVEAGHVCTHVVGPFEDLWANVDKECVRGPPAEDHDPSGTMVH